MPNSDESPNETVRTNWWYVLALVAPRAPVSTVLFSLYLLSFRSVGSIIVPLTYLAIGLLLLLPLALYWGIRAVNRAGVDWSPNAGST